MGRRSQSRDSFAAIRYAVDTGSMPPQPKRSFLARHRRVVLPVAVVTLLGAGFIANESRRQPAPTATAALDCNSARDIWRPACRPENVQTWVAKAAAARDDAPASTGALDDARRASTPKRVVETARSKPETAPAPAPQPAASAAEPATPAKAPPRVAAAPEAPPEPARTPEAVKPAPGPVRAVEAKPAEPQASAKLTPRPAVPAAKLSEPQPLRQAAKPAEPQPVGPAPQPVEQAAKGPEPQPVQQVAKPVEPQVPAKPVLPLVEQQAAKPEPLPPVVVEPPRRPAPPVKVAEEPAAPAVDQVKAKTRQKRLAQSAAKREARIAAERQEEQRTVARRVVIGEEPAAPRRLARVRAPEQGVRTTAYFPPGFVQALRHYNARYAYDY
jgi:hypothetical protein